MARPLASDEQQVERLFASLAEQVKLPFLQVARAAELLGTDVQTDKNKQTIIETSQAATRLIDGFLLTMRLQQESQLALEPISISSVLFDTAELLDRYAKMHDCELELDVAGKYGPVMAHGAGLQAALANIGYSFIDAAESGRPKVIKLGVRRTRGGITAGVYSDASGLSSNMLKQAKLMHGKVHQPMTSFTNDTAAGVFVADSLLESLGAPMRIAHMRGMTGLAATFAPSRQLSLV